MNGQYREEAPAMARWKINLVVLWFGNFFVMAGMTMIIPFLPLYLKEMGLQNEHSIGVWASLIFAGNFVTALFAQPIWGGIADRYGHKLMLLRSGFGMAIVMTLMGFANSPWQLLLLRMLNGTIAVFIPAAVALVSTNTPQEKTGFAMGTLQSGGTAGTILGPLIGGLLAEAFGYRPIFYLTGIFILVASILTMVLVKDKFDKVDAKQREKVSTLAGARTIFKLPQIPALFAVTFMIQFAILSPMPIMPLFVEQLHGQTAMLAFYAGLVGSINGFSNMLSSPFLGRIGDKLGAEKILGICLIGSAIAFIPQAFVQNIWQLMVSRFLLGLFMGGLLPSVYSLIKRYTPKGMESRAYSLNSSTLSLGNMLGPIVGGVLAGWISIRGVFLVAAAMLLLNSIWVRKTLTHKQRE
jgi:MFS family permease